MQPLPRGVTGFNFPEHGVPVKRFTSACHTAARQARARVHHVRGAYEQVMRSFHEAKLTLRDGTETVRVLCNAHYPIVAFASPAAQEWDVRVQFVECPLLAEHLSGEFTILSVQDACAGVSPAAIAQLGEAELDQMRYWNPQRIGDVIFNYWD